MTDSPTPYYEVTFALTARDRTVAACPPASRPAASPNCSSSPRLDTKRTHAPTPLQGMFTIAGGMLGDRGRVVRGGSLRPSLLFRGTNRATSDTRPPRPAGRGAPDPSFPAKRRTWRDGCHARPPAQAGAQLQQLPPATPPGSHQPPRPRGSRDAGRNQGDNRRVSGTRQRWPSPGRSREGMPNPFTKCGPRRDGCSLTVLLRADDRAAYRTSHGRGPMSPR